MINGTNWKTTYRSEKGLSQAASEEDEAAYIEAENEMRRVWNIANGFDENRPYTPKNSPMAQFDESHAKWIESGREC